MFESVCGGSLSEVSLDLGKFSFFQRKKAKKFH